MAGRVLGSCLTPIPSTYNKNTSIVGGMQQEINPGFQVHAEPFQGDTFALVIANKVLGRILMSPLVPFFAVYGVGSRYKSPHSSLSQQQL